MTITWQPSNYYPAQSFVEPLAVEGFGYEVTTAGTSGVSEPAWPTTAGATVADGSVVWTAREAIVLTWKAVPLYKSGAVEPAWPTTVGGTVVDGSVTWTMRTPAITDPKCPQSKVAMPIASKVYSPYRDVTRYSVTNNPRDWSTVNDAGFIPTGLHAPTSPEVTALGEYRGRLVAWTPSNMQVWTVDPDPREITIFDSIPGFGCTFPDAVVPVIDDLYFMSKQGIRSVSISASSSNLRTGDVGSGIDPLVVAKLSGPEHVRGTYYPGHGQAWFVFGNEAFVYSRSRIGKVGAWSRYTFPWTITDVLQLNGELYARAGDNFYRFDENTLTDDGTGFEGIVWTPYLELGSPGTTKMIDSFDMVGYGVATLEVGFDQSDTSLYTPPFPIGPDTVPGGRVPIPAASPSFAFKLTYAAGQQWQLNAMQVYVHDLGFGT